MSDGSHRESCWRTVDCTLPPGHRPPCLPFGVATVLPPAERPALPGESAAVLSGEVGPRSVPADVPPGAEGLVVGPDEVLVISFAVDLAPHEMRALRAQLEQKLPPARFVIVAGYNAHIGKVRVQSDRGEIDNGVLRASLPSSDMQPS